ncbi:DICT sensory domain-containing protein [Halegenticoccus tardaugens]|uniref:DICT sensory domain-containing protein n=1 Tax=Halegenticoccus tardaugens TaxID=2071624 RepID=UPI00100A4B59|nr:DICT sensory domain-containing protein [Halegenticoccus tardaugens]
MSLKELIRDLESRRKTVTIFAHEPDPGLAEYFDDWHVSVEYERLPRDGYEEFVVVSEGDEYLGSVGVGALAALQSPRIRDPGRRKLAEADLHYLLELLDDSVFSSFDRRQMLAASREFEDRAARVGRGTLSAGFQSLSAMRRQLPVYRELASLPGLSVHVYGRADWDPPDVPGVVVHRLADGELADVWFVAYDGGGNPMYECALVAEEVGPGDFYGFWTYDPALVDRVFDAVREAAAGDPVDENETP